MKEGSGRLGYMSERNIRSASSKLRVTFCDNLISTNDEMSEKSSPVRIVRVPSASIKKCVAFGSETERVGTPKPILKYSKDRLNSEDSPQSFGTWTDGLKQRLKRGLQETSHFESMLQPRLDSARGKKLGAVSDRNSASGKSQTGQIVIKKRPIHSSDSRSKLFKSAFAETSDYKISTTKQFYKRTDPGDSITAMKKSFVISRKEPETDLKVDENIEKKCTCFITEVPAITVSLLKLKDMGVSNNRLSILLGYINRNDKNVIQKVQECIKNKSTANIKKLDTLIDDKQCIENLESWERNHKYRIHQPIC